MKLRIALHAGELQWRDDDVAGLASNHAARFRSAANGGQVIASRAIVELAGQLDGELRWHSLGPHRIRDLPGWTEAFQLHGPGLPAKFGPLATLDTGLPPLAASVMLDAYDTLGGSTR